MRGAGAFRCVATKSQLEVRTAEQGERTLICSSEDFMSDRKLGCLNSQVCVGMVSYPLAGEPERRTHVLAVRSSALLGVLDLVKVVLVELAHERGEIAVLEVEREDGSGEGVHVL